MTKKQGKIIAPAQANIWPHEQKTAKALALQGHVVEFIPVSKKKYETTADLLVDGVKWEMKAPKSKRLAAVERNLKRGARQCSRIVFDSRRMKYISDKNIMRELAKQLHLSKCLIAIKFINPHGRVIDIK